jgi:nucleoside-diphosphate-sugar epimerase
MWLDAGKMKKLGWEPSVGLTDAYRRMIRWMQNNE